MNFFIFILSLMFVLSCSKAPNKIVFNKTTAKELIALEGEPKEIKETSVPEINTFIYDENKKYQIRDGLVESSFRDPVGEETRLIYWKHKFKDSSGFVGFQNKTNHVGSHPAHEIQLDLAEVGISLMYNEQTDQVTRIIEYVKK